MGTGNYGLGNPLASGTCTSSLLYGRFYGLYFEMLAAVFVHLCLLSGHVSCDVNILGYVKINVIKCHYVFLKSLVL